MLCHPLICNICSGHLSLSRLIAERGVRRHIHLGLVGKLSITVRILMWMSTSNRYRVARLGIAANAVWLLVTTGQTAWIVEGLCHHVGTSEF
eukprot:5648901-Amphidinium_carterae.1